jgi:hypothetical protein
MAKQLLGASAAVHIKIKKDIKALEQWERDLPAQARGGEDLFAKRSHFIERNQQSIHA